jgi:hypothetical protein
MALLSEDPTLLSGGLLLVAGAFLIALNITQQGKHLIYAGIALALAVIVVIIEWLWVTDAERIEKVIYDLRQAALTSDADGALAHMTPTVQYLQGDIALSEEATRELIRVNLRHAQFDFVRLSDLRISVGYESRRAKAEFRAFTRGSFRTPVTSVQTGTAISTWSLGFEETEPGIWKVNRISPVSVPLGALALPGNVPALEELEPVFPAANRSMGTVHKRGVPQPVGAMRAHKQINSPVGRSSPD